VPIASYSSPPDVSSQADCRTAPAPPSQAPSQSHSP
jgi:hypothetical protein